jgi:hypothetical protein
MFETINKNNSHHPIISHPFVSCPKNHDQASLRFTRCTQLGCHPPLRRSMVSPTRTRKGTWGACPADFDGPNGSQKRSQKDHHQIPHKRRKMIIKSAEFIRIQLSALFETSEFDIKPYQTQT